MADETNEGGTPETTPTIESFDSWIATQPDNIKSLYTAHTSGLKTALESEREQRKTFAKQLREATAQVEQGSALQKALQEMTATAEQAQRRATFAEEATRPDVGCSNVRAAYLVAQADDLFTKTGDPDWKAIKAAAPELFARKTAQANAGSGTQAPPRTNNVNDFIRRAAGRA
jgi:hypothetical protein